MTRPGWGTAETPYFGSPTSLSYTNRYLVFVCSIADFEPLIWAFGKRTV
jgi:hypothetical protein